MTDAHQEVPNTVMSTRGRLGLPRTFTPSESAHHEQDDTGRGHADNHHYEQDVPDPLDCSH
jgi:hypothetical protein